MTRTSVPSLTWKDYAAARAGAGWCWNPARETAEQGRVRSHLATARALYALRHDPDAYVDFVLYMELEARREEMTERSVN